METPLLTTKLYIPPARPGLVARPRLLECMQKALDCRLILVSAPAGSGKTTLVSDWARQNREQVATAWISLDEGDNDPVRFWDYFIAALRTLHPAVGETALSLLHSPQPYATESVLTALINNLADIQQDFAIILDDYHLIRAEPIHAGIAYLLEHLPLRMHLVIATRSEPPIPLAHFRGQGKMLEIGADDLRFTVQEAGGLLKAMQGLELTAEETSSLVERTEGWAVGLSMAALSMGKQKDISGYIASFTGNQRYVMDYLVDEVLSQQPEEVRDFLLKTSILERLTGGLCDYISGHSSGQEMLQRLEQSNMFLIPLDESRQWYRYHHLFAELLRQQLEVKSGAEEVTRLHQRASQWCEEHGLIDDAIHHVLAARDWERAMRLIYTQSGARINRAEFNTVSSWFQAIPDKVLRTHPRLYGQYARTLINLGQLRAAEIALSYLEQSSQDDGSFQGELAAYRMSLAYRRGDFAYILEFGERALALLPPDNLAVRARVSYLLGFVHLIRAHLKKSQSLMADACEMGMKAGDLWVGSNGAGYLGTILWRRGRLQQALDMARRAVDLAGQSPAAALPLWVLASVLYELNDLEGAARSAQLAIELSEPGRTAEPSIVNYFLLAQKQLAQGAEADAVLQMQKADQVALHPSVPPYMRAGHTANRVMFAIQQEDLASAIDWGKRLSEYPDDVLPVWYQLVRPRLLIALGEKTAAAAQLLGLYERAVQAGAQGFVIVIRVCQALAAVDPAQGLTYLAEALTLGQPEGYIRTFVDEGRLLAPLLRQAIAQGISAEYAGKLLDIIEKEELFRKAKREGPPPLRAFGLLSERELEVLRLLAAGHSNRQIATRLFISLGTVKVHVHNLAEKLNAASRTQAIARAKELKLL